MTSLALSRLTGRPVASNSLVARAAPAPGNGSTSAAALQQSFIAPQARDRWQTQTLKSYTPDRVEQIVRGVVAGDLQAQWKMFDLMEQTWPRLAKNLGDLKDAAISVEWPLQPWSPKGGQPSPEAVRRARICEEAIWHMQPAPDSDENDFEDTLRDLLDAKGKGISVLEIDWHARPYEGGSIFAPRCTRWINPRYYGYPPTGAKLMINATELGASAGFNGTPSPLAFAGGMDGYVPFPANKFLIGVSKTKTGHPISGALLRTLGWWWAASNFTWGWFLNYTQLFGMPIRLAFHDPNASAPTIQQIQDMLENMGSAAYGTFPAGTQIDFKSDVKNATGSAHEVLIKMADKICDLLILRQTLTSDTGDNGSGSRALGEVHEGVLEDVRLGCARWAAKVLSAQLLRPICLLNFGDDRECPWFMPAKGEHEDPKALAERDNILLAQGVEMEKAWFYDRHGIPVPAPGADVIVGRPAMMPGFPGPGGQIPGSGLPPAAEDTATAHAKAVDQLIERTLEDLTDVQAKWLGGLKPPLHRLIALAESKNVSDADFIAAAEKLVKEMPELFTKLKPQALAKHLEGALGAAVINGALQAAMKRRTA
jgi:phage gp29-like protein